MKTFILLITITLSTWANGSFYDLYAQNRATGKPNLITADFIASSYAMYKLSREQEVEEKVLKPRILNFANYLYQGVIEMNIAQKEQALAYTGVLSLLAKGGQNLIIPDGYEHLQGVILQEAKFIMNANKIAISPVMKVKVDYRAFKVPKKYINNSTYFRTMKYLQTIPVPQSVKQTIKASERLINLERYIKQIQQQFIGVETKSKTLLSTYKGLDYYIFKKSKIPSIEEIAKALNPKTSKSPIIQQHLLNLYSSYDYDFKIMQTLLKNGRSNAFKGYYTQSQYRNMLYRTPFKTKGIHQETRVKANMEVKLEETLSVMIEGALVFANSIKNNEIDKNMIMTLKELRKVAQKKSMNMAFTAKDINFLNSLDLVFLELTGVRDMPFSVKVTNTLTQELSAPRLVRYGKAELHNFTWGGRFVHGEF
jgi:hypothetical protein